MSVTSEVTEASEKHPTYRKVLDLDSGATPIYFIVCDEGWRESIVAQGLYGWCADWLLKIIGNKPFAKGFRP